MVSVRPVYFPMKEFMYQSRSRRRYEICRIYLPTQSLFSQPKKSPGIVGITDYHPIEVPVMDCPKNNPFFGATELPIRATEKALASHSAVK
jgi:hypothetical protein